MPAPKVDSAIVEYSFSKEEWIAARTLSLVQICNFHTKYAMLMKKKASLLIPNKANMANYEFVAEIAEIDGQMAMIQEILTDHQQAQLEMNDPERNPPESGATPAVHDDLAARAAKHVHTS